MGGLRKSWKDTWEYLRVLEILNDYWLTEKDEFRVRIQMDFIKANGETQEKCIQWENPNYTCENSPKTLDDCIIDIRDLGSMTEYELWEREQKRFWNTGKIIKKEKSND